MKILNTNELNQIKELAKMESDLINQGFAISTEYGLLFLSNSISSFVDNYLKVRYGNILLSMCSEYRVFIVELLILIKEEYKPMAFNKILLGK